ncbi:MAG: CapA family protein [Hydrogenophaga sp.]
MIRAILILLLCGAFSHARAAGLSLVFAGDTTLDDAPGELIERGGDPLAKVAHLFQGADIRLVNLECVVSTTGSPGDKVFTFRAHPRVLPVLRRHVDAVTLANNHSGDYGREAFADMLGLLDRHGIRQVGGGRHLAEAHHPLLLERQGLRVALLSYNEFMPRSFEADHNAPGIAWSEDEQVAEDVAKARSLHRADLVLAFMHWGWENEPKANARQRQLARLILNAGADAVIGGHPHVTQDIEILQGKPVIYSVGNLVMKETDNAAQRQAWVLQLGLDRQGVSSLQAHPVRLDMDGIPAPAPDLPSPCWRRGALQVSTCSSR